MTQKEGQEISVLGKLLCMEALLLLAGIVCLVSGIVTGETMQLFWGGLIISGSVILYFVKKKDWKKHWEEQEAFRQLVEEKAREKKEKDAAEK